MLGSVVAGGSKFKLGLLLSPPSPLPQKLRSEDGEVYCGGRWRFINFWAATSITTTSTAAGAATALQVSHGFYIFRIIVDPFSCCHHCVCQSVCRTERIRIRLTPPSPTPHPTPLVSQSIFSHAPVVGKYPMKYKVYI